MEWMKIFLSFVFFVLVIFLLMFYWIIPREAVNFIFNPGTGNSNFSLNNYWENMQFYPNMRYPDSKISYRIENCPLQKENDMERAFEIISENTTLEFYPVDSDEEISVTCDEKTKIDGGLFIGGEGGPTNITLTENFNVISHGKILLIRNSDCERPNIAIHELLHALGFEHSLNPDNIMYNITKCNQVIGEDTFNLLNELYSYPSYSDLSFENVSAVMRGKYLDLNMSIRNNGLKNSGDAEIRIYADDKFVEKIDLEQLEIGRGIILTLKNVFVNKITVGEIKISINNSFSELEKKNNFIVLKIKE